MQMNRPAITIENLVKADFRGAPLGTSLDRLQQWHRRHRTRQALGRLDSHRLADLGLSETDRARELAKWFWQK